MESTLSDSRILVTGASGRLGRKLCSHLLARGAAVIGIDQARVDLESERFEFLGADLTSAGDVERAFGSIVARSGEVDAVVHAVGMWGMSPLAETPVAEFETMIRVNLTSAFLCFREAARAWLAADRGGHLVAMASSQGADRAAPQQAAYSAAKAGIVRLVEATSLEYRDQGITAVALAPSMILFGDEPPGTEGVTVDRIVRICEYLATDGAVVHNGTVVRAYGTMV